jgi:hypothetical protein
MPMAIEVGSLVASFEERKKSSSSFYLIERSSREKKAALICVRDWIIESFAKTKSEA